jgi:hypothetical protein
VIAHLVDDLLDFDLELEIQVLVVLLSQCFGNGLPPSQARPPGLRGRVRL